MSEGVPTGRRLTGRQKEILELVASGLSDKEIARQLGVSYRTVRTHFERLFRDQHVHTRASAVAALMKRPSE